MTTKDDVAKGFASIGGLIQNIGNTIKEQQRQKQVQKVLSQFKDPNKLFLNEDGTPKSDSEIAPMLNQGVMSLYQLGEDKLANSLTEYYSNMSKSFDKTSQNAFNYDVNSDDNLFPKTQNGQAIAFNERVDYGKFQGTKQFKPPDPKRAFKFELVDMGKQSGVKKYYKQYLLDTPYTDETGRVWQPGEFEVIDENAYQNETRKSYNYSTGPVNLQRVQIKDGDQEYQGTYNPRDGSYEYNGKKVKAKDMPSGIDVRNIDAGYDENTPKNSSNNNMSAKDISDLILSRADDYDNMDSKDIKKYVNMYSSEIQNWVNGGNVPSFMTTDWIQNNSDIYLQLKKLKGK